MDRVDIQIKALEQQGSRRAFLESVSSLRLGRSQEPRDQVELDRRRAPIAAEGDEHVAATPAPLAQNAEEQPRPSDEALQQLLLEDLPPEVQAAAREILKNQLKKGNQPRTSLKAVQRPDMQGVMDRLEACSPVLEDIMDDAPPLPPEAEAPAHSGR